MGVMQRWGLIEALKNNMTSGELSPKLYRRSDIEQYKNGLATCENGIVSLYGGVNRRAGFRYITAAKNSDKICIVRPFIFSSSQRYFFEIGEYYVRFYTSGAQIIHSSSTVSSYVGGTTYSEGDYVKYGVSDTIYRSKVDSNTGNTPDSSPTYWEETNIVEVTTPYTEAQLRGLRFETSGDVCYIYHNSHPPAKITRYSHTSWTYTVTSFTGGPFETTNSTTTTLASTAVTGTATITASSATFQNDHVGSVWSLTSGEMVSEVTGTFTATGNSSDVSTGSEKVEIELSGTWVGTIIIQRSFNKGTDWYDYRSSTENIITKLEDTRDIQYRVSCTAYTSGTISYRLSVLSEEAEGYGSFKITAVASSTSCTATIVEQLRSTDATTIWAEPSWSGVRGYPRSGKIYEGRMVPMSTSEEVYGAWGSSSLIYDDFTAGTNDADAFKFTLNARGGINEVMWQVARDQMIVGTSGGELRVYSDDGMSPSSIPEKKQDTNYGSANIQAFIAARAVLFIDSSERTLREYIYDDKTRTYDSEPLSLLAEHILVNGEGVIDMAYQEKQHQIIWCVLSDGTLGAMTYNPPQSVVGWHRHTTQGNVESICSIPGDNGHDDIVISVKRVINGSDVRYIELLDEDQTGGFGQCAAPVMTPSSQHMTLTDTVTLTVSTSGADIYYTLDGATPDKSDDLYSSPFTLPAATTAVIVKAIGIFENDSYTDSDVTTEYYQLYDGFTLDISLLGSTETYDLLT